MSQKPSTPLESPYWCFISYRHADDKAQDRDWASWLTQEIERYEVPAELVGTQNKRGDVIPERIYPVFRDEVSLPANADLASSITQALDRSRYLVVLCSPRAVESQYVAEEVLHFKQARKEDRIIAAILDGEPGHAQQECFPTPLRHPIGDNGELDPTRKAEPMAADFRLPDGHQGFTSAEAYRLVLSKHGALNEQQVKAQADAYELHLQLMKLKIIAGILGVPLEQLRNRDKAYQLELARRRARVLRRWLAAIGTLTILVFAAGIVANQQRIRAQIQELTAFNRTLETSLELVTRFWSNGDVPQAVAGLSRAAALARQMGNHPRATEKERDREELLRRQLDLMRHGWRVLVEPEGVRDYSWSPDGTRVATLSQQGQLRLWDASTGRPIAQASTRLGDARKIRVTNSGTRMFAAGDRAVQEAIPLYIWRWDPEVDSIEEVYMQGNTDEGEGAELRLFEMSPQGKLFVLDFLGLKYLKEGASGQLEEVHVSGDSVEEFSFDQGEDRWLGRTQHSFFRIDPTNSQVTEVLADGKGIFELVHSRLLSASGKHYAYRFQTHGGGKVRWRELANGGAEGEFIIKPPGKERHAGRPPFDFELAMLSANGATLALPVLGGANERLELYDTSNGSFAGVFRLPPERKYDRVRFSPMYRTMAAPAPYGVELWSPFFYEPATEPEERAGKVTLTVDDAGALITLELGEERRALGLHQLRDPDEVQHVLGISNALRWPDRNHLLVGFSDQKIGYYQIEPFKKLELWTHQVDRASLTESQKYILRVEGSFLNLTASPDGRHFISWSEYGGAQIWNLQQAGSQARALGSLRDIDQILFRHDGGAIWALHDQEASELSVFRAGESSSLLRTIPVGFESQIWKTAPDLGIVVVVKRWPNLIIDANTGMSLASYFQNSQGMTTPGAYAFQGVGESLLQSIDRNVVGEPESAKDEGRTGYRWKSDMAAPILLSWDELKEVWKENK
jgi:WD40 repeat protein